MISKETRFVDLPQEVKQKLINIHRLSQQTYIPLESEKIVNFNGIYSELVDIPTEELKRQYIELYSNFKNLKDIYDNKIPIDSRYLEENLRGNIQDLKKEIELYKESCEDLDFYGSLVTTFKVLEKKYDYLNRRN